MAKADATITSLQAKILRALYGEFLTKGITGGLTYRNMLYNETIKATSLPAIKKAIRDLRTRTRPLVSSYSLPADHFGITKSKGRPTEMFTVHPTNRLPDGEMAHYLLRLYGWLPSPRESHRNIPEFNALSEFLANQRFWFRDSEGNRKRLLAKLDQAHELGYLSARVDPAKPIRRLLTHQFMAELPLIEALARFGLPNGDLYWGDSF